MLVARLRLAYDIIARDPYHMLTQSDKHHVAIITIPVSERLGVYTVTDTEERRHTSRRRLCREDTVR